MCNSCYGYIYDILITPLPLNHILNGYINITNLTKCSHEVVNCIAKSLNELLNNIYMIEYLKRFRENYEKTKLGEYECDKLLWDKFEYVYNTEYKELTFAIQICMDNMVVKKIIHKVQCLEQFFMYKLRILITNLPDIHKEHTEKKEYINRKSLGSVPYYRIDEIRIKAGLPISGMISISIVDDDLYN